MKLFYILLLTLIAGLIANFLYSRSRFSYVGAQKCKTCHGSEAIGNQNKIWRSSPHAKAVLILRYAKARKIGAKYGVKEPHKSIKCLKCHTTGRGKVAALNSEGVGCEACHGPGSKYHEPEIHINYLDRKKGYKKAVRYGMYPILYDHLKNREKLCKYCHNNKRPCLPEDAAGRLKQKLTIQVIDKLQKGYVKFKHPLRR